MRLGTKILLFTLAVTLSLSGLVVWVVTQEVTAAETSRVRDNIRADVADYFHRLDETHGLVAHALRELFKDPQKRADLEIEGGANALRPAAQTQLEDVTFPTEVVKALPDVAELAKPAFHLLLGPRGQVLAASANEPALKTAVVDPSLKWPTDEVLEDRARTRRYFYFNDRLFLAIGVPLRLLLADEPEHAYFIAFEIDRAWIKSRLSSRADSPIDTWYRVDGRALVGDSPAGWLSQGVLLEPRDVEAYSTERRHAISFVADGQRFVGELVNLSVLGAASAQGELWIASSLDAALSARLRPLYRDIALATGAVVLLAIAVTRWMSRRIARPIEQLDAAATRIARGDFSGTVQTTRRDELGQLARSFNAMAAGLAQRDLIKDTFGKFVSPQLVEQFLDDPERLKPGGERRVMSVLFADLAGFTSTAERVAPESMVKLLNAFFTGASDAIERERGIVDKLVGDGIVAFFGPPLLEPHEHAGAACRAALGIVASAMRHDALCQEFGAPPMRVRVGVATGEVLVGNIGSRSRYTYTVLGDTANLASRLEGVNKVYGTSILVSSTTAGAAHPQVITRKIDTVRVPGRIEPVEVFEVLGERVHNYTVVEQRGQRYEDALKLYESKQWKAAREQFAMIDEHDEPARRMVARCEAFAARAPEDGWSGVWTVETK